MHLVFGNVVCLYRLESACPDMQRYFGRADAFRRKLLLIRSGNEQSLLLGDWTDWKQYRDIRSRTSHAYDEEIALEVLAGIPAFLKEARHLRNKLKERLA